MGLKPSHRDTRRLQPEVCAVSGRLVPVSDLIQSEVEGLRGFAVSSITPFLARARVLPSYNDRQRMNPGPALEDIQRHEVAGVGAQWWNDWTDLYLVDDDGNYIVDDDGNYIFRDSP